MTPSEVIAVVAVVNVLLTIGSIVFTWYTNLNRAQRAEIEALEKVFADRDERRRADINDLRDRITTAEANIEHLPNNQHLGDVYDKVNGVARDVSSMGATLTAMGAQVARIETYLMNEGKK